MKFFCFGYDINLSGKENYIMYRGRVSSVRVPSRVFRSTVCVSFFLLGPKLPDKIDMGQLKASTAQFKDDFLHFASINPQGVIFAGSIVFILLSMMIGIIRRR